MCGGIGILTCEIQGGASLSREERRLSSSSFRLADFDGTTAESVDR